MAHSLKNPLLIKTKNSVEKNLPKELQEPVERIVLAGMKLLYSPETHASIVQPVYEAIKTNGFKPEDIANGMVNLLMTIYKASKGQMPVEAAFPAGVILLCYVLDDLEQTKGAMITPEMLKVIGEVMIKQFVKGFQLNQASGAQSGAQNPANSQPEGLAQSAASPPPATETGVA